MFARLNRYARYAYAPMAALALWAVLLALLPAVANAEETSTRTNVRANAQDTAHRTAHHVVVAPGDCLWSISEKQLGPGATGPQIARGVERIYALNRDLIGADPDLIFAGQRFALPRSLGRHGAERHASGRAPRQARQQSRAAHPKTPAARMDRGDGSRSIRATGPAVDRSGEDFAGRTAKVPVAAHTQDVPEGGTLPDEVPVAPVPAVGQLTAGVTPSTPISYLGYVRAGVSSAVSTLIDAVVTDDRYAGRQLLGLVLILVSLGIGVFPIVRATWRAARRAMVRHEREKDRSRRVAAYPAADVPAGLAAPRTRKSRHSEEPTVSTQGESTGGSSPEGPRRNAGRSRSRGRSAVRRKASRTNRRRKVVGENREVPDSGRDWQIGEALRHSFEEFPLRPDAFDDALAELKPQIEKELRSVALVERRRTLSDREYRQANALRDLLALARHDLNGRR